MGVKVQLQELRATTAQAQTEVIEMSLDPPKAIPALHLLSLSAAAEPESSEGDQIAIIQAELELSPRRALVLTSGLIEKELKQVLAAFGLISSYVYPTQGLRLLEQRKIVPSALLQAIDEFDEVRRRVGQTALDGRLAAEAVESGIAILNVLRAIPRSHHEVKRVGIRLFSDPRAQMPVQGVTGVVIGGLDQYGNPAQMTQIFPTTREMVSGTRVSWEWNQQNTWPETWFRDPDTGVITHAWSSSAEFIGRDIRTL